jgi:hypothetical protein
MATAMAELDLKRELGFGDLALREQELDLRDQWNKEEMDYRYWAREGDWGSAINQIKEQEPSWWEKTLGFVGGLFSTKKVKRILAESAPRYVMRQHILDAPIRTWRYIWSGERRHGIVLEDAPEFARGPFLDVPNILNHLIATVQLQQAEIDALKETQ